MSQADRIEQLLSQLVTEVSTLTQDMATLREEVQQIEKQMVKKEDFLQALHILHSVHRVTSALTQNQIETQENVVELKRKESRA